MKINISNTTIVYIITPFLDKGGARSLHQLADELMKKKINVELYYFDNVDAEHCCCSDMNIPVTKNIVDSNNNVLIVPEQYIRYSLKYKNVKKIIWWLSLYFYKMNDKVWHVKFLLKKKGIPAVLFPLYFSFHVIKNRKMYQKNKYKIIDNHLKDYYHLYNCEYVKQYLIKKKIDKEKMAYLCGPITKDFIDIKKESCIKGKENIISVNPVKVDKRILKEFRKKIESKLDVKIIEIKSMSSRQVKETLMKSKLYVDLGYFPGPERMPREAVMLYCNVFTSNIGAAFNDVDVPIPRYYKCDLVHERMDSIVDRVISMIDRYEEQIIDFDKYRIIVENQIKRFRIDIFEIFKIEGEKFANKC